MSGFFSPSLAQLRFLCTNLLVFFFFLIIIASFILHGFDPISSEISYGVSYKCALPLLSFPFLPGYSHLVRVTECVNFYSQELFIRSNCDRTSVALSFLSFLRPGNDGRGTAARNSPREAPARGLRRDKPPRFSTNFQRDEKSFRP